VMLMRTSGTMISRFMPAEYIVTKSTRGLKRRLYAFKRHE
jgi:hypothetical protein